jgi:adenylylsulfate kinase
MEQKKSSDVVWHAATVTRQDREKLFGHRGAVLWFTGLSGSGKSTVAHEVENRLHGMGCHTYVLDGDNLRHGLNGDLGFSAEDRQENIRRLAELVKLFSDAGVIVLSAFISPFRADRQQARSLAGNRDFFEIHCRCGIATCEERDPKGLYKKARAGEIADFTGISSPYEEPENPEIIIDTDKHPVEVCAEMILARLRQAGAIK